jgi:hypothetical protein
LNIIPKFTSQTIEENRVTTIILKGTDLTRKPILIPGLEYEINYVSSKKILIKLTDISSWRLGNQYKIKILTHNINDQIYHHMDKIIVVHIFNTLPFENFEYFIDENHQELKKDYFEVRKSLEKYFGSLLKQKWYGFLNLKTSTNNYEDLLNQEGSKLLGNHEGSNYLEKEESIINNKNNNEVFEIIKKVNQIRVNLKSKRYDELGTLAYFNSNTRLSIENFEKSKSIMSMFSLGN